MDLIINIAFVKTKLISLYRGRDAQSLSQSCRKEAIYWRTILFITFVYKVLSLTTLNSFKTGLLLSLSSSLPILYANLRK